MLLKDDDEPRFVEELLLLWEFIREYAAELLDREEALGKGGRERSLCWIWGVELSIVTGSNKRRSDSVLATTYAPCTPGRAGASKWPVWCEERSEWTRGRCCGSQREVLGRRQCKETRGAVSVLRAGLSETEWRYSLVDQGAWAGRCTLLRHLRSVAVVVLLRHEHLVVRGTENH